MKLVSILLLLLGWIGLGAGMLSYQEMEKEYLSALKLSDSSKRAVAIMDKLAWTPEENEDFLAANLGYYDSILKRLMEMEAGSPLSREELFLVKSFAPVYLKHHSVTDEPQELFAAGISYFVSGELKKSRRMFRRALAKRNIPGARFMLGQLAAYDNGRDLPMFQEAILRNPFSALEFLDYVGNHNPESLVPSNLMIWACNFYYIIQHTPALRDNPYVKLKAAQIAKEVFAQMVFLYCGQVELPEGKNPQIFAEEYGKRLKNIPLFSLLNECKLNVIYQVNWQISESKLYFIGEVKFCSPANPECGTLQIRQVDNLLGNSKI